MGQVVGFGGDIFVPLEDLTVVPTAAAVLPHDGSTSGKNRPPGSYPHQAEIFLVTCWKDSDQHPSDMFENQQRKSQDV